MIFTDSVTQQFSDPRSIGFKGPYPKFQKLTLQTRYILFSLLFFFPAAAFSCSPAPPSTSSPALKSCLLGTSARFGFSFLPSVSFAWPKALIAKLVYIGEINALQMRLNTYSEKCRQCVSGLSPKSGGERRPSLAQSWGARVKPADTVRLIHFSGEREEDLAFAC